MESSYSVQPGSIKKEILKIIKICNFFVKHEVKGGIVLCKKNTNNGFYTSPRQSHFNQT